jgi:hypothetical protein
MTPLASYMAGRLIIGSCAGIGQAALRWHGRYCREVRDVELEERQAALAALVALRGNRKASLQPSCLFRLPYGGARLDPGPRPRVRRRPAHQAGRHRRPRTAPARPPRVGRIVATEIAEAVGRKHWLRHALFLGSPSGSRAPFRGLPGRLASGASLLVVCTARPELLERRPRLSRSITRSPTPRRSTRSSVEAVRPRERTVVLRLDHSALESSPLG